MGDQGAGCLWGSLQPQSKPAGSHVPKIFLHLSLVGQMGCMITQSVADWPGLVSGQTFPSCESTQPLAKQLRVEGPKEKVWFCEVLQKQNDEVSKGWVVEWL